MLRFHGVMVRPRFAVYDDDGELVDEAIGPEVAVFTVEQFERFIGDARAEAEKHAATDPRLISS